MLSIILANFWTWAGTVILVATVLGGVADVVKAAQRDRGPERAIKTYDFGNGTKTVEITCATEEDLREIVAQFAQGGTAGTEGEQK